MTGTDSVTVTDSVTEAVAGTETDSVTEAGAGADSGPSQRRLVAFNVIR